MMPAAEQQTGNRSNIPVPSLVTPWKEETKSFLIMYMFQGPKKASGKLLND
jgi:hypothetical protein